MKEVKGTIMDIDLCNSIIVSIILRQADGEYAYISKSESLINIIEKNIFSKGDRVIMKVEGAVFFNLERMQH